MDEGDICRIDGDIGGGAAGHYLRIGALGHGRLQTLLTEKLGVARKDGFALGGGLSTVHQLSGISTSSGDCGLPMNALTWSSAGTVLL